MSQPHKQNKQQKGPRFTAKRVRRGIKLDRVNPKDFLNLNMVYCCEECSHFNPQETTCSLGFPTADHLREQQMKTFLTNSHMAFCRFMEID